MSPRSGLQKDVMSLYRRALRMVRTKPAETRPKFALFVRYTFHHNAAVVSPRNFSFIEHQLRQGKKQLEMYENPSLKDCFLSTDMLKWAEDERRSR